VFRDSFAAGSVMGQGTNLTTADLPFNDAGLKTFARFGRLSGNTATGGLSFTYNMESQDCYRFVGKTLTLSFYYRTGANFSGTSLGGRIYTGTGPDEAVRNGLTGGTFVVATYNPNTSWQRGSLTYTIGTNINQICLLFGYTPTGTAGAADYFDITGVQLELGSVATPFEVRPYPVELQLCQRYYIRWVATKLYTHFPVTGYISSPGNFFGTIITQTNLRISPNSQSQFTTSGIFEVVGSFQSSNITIDIDSSSINSFRILATGTGGTAGFGGVLRAAASIGAFLAIDVEL
jgi:hypothetical protein